MAGLPSDSRIRSGAHISGSPRTATAPLGTGDGREHPRRNGSSTGRFSLFNENETPASFIKASVSPGASTVPEPVQIPCLRPQPRTPGPTRPRGGRGGCAPGVDTGRGAPRRGRHRRRRGGGVSSFGNRFVCLFVYRLSDFTRGRAEASGLESTGIWASGSYPRRRRRRRFSSVTRHFAVFYPQQNFTVG